MNEAQRVAEKYFKDEYVIGCVEAIQEFAQAVAENDEIILIISDQPDDEADAYDHGYYQGLQAFRRLLLREAGIEEKNG